jgi:oligopeptide/dipeptide ABC transporter ATP-binding protein
VSELEALFRVDNLRKQFPIRGGGLSRRHIPAVDGVSFQVEKGETLGIVGESGSGKTTLARLMLKLTPPTSGRLFFEGRDITRLGGAEMKKLRRRLQMVFQDPYSSLDPTQFVFDIVAEPLRVHKMGDGGMKEKIQEALALVELPVSEEFLWKLPEELSGGERQRLGIARVLVLGAELIVADEPVSMLDASVKAAIASLLMELKDRKDLTYVFITHEIGLAYHVCDRIAVMFMGKIVEVGPAEGIVTQPQHPYTKILMDATPPLLPDESWMRRRIASLETPSYGKSIQGCGFSARCPYRKDICEKEWPELIEADENHRFACHASALRR